MKYSLERTKTVRR